MSGFQLFCYGLTIFLLVASSWVAADRIIALERRVYAIEKRLGERPDSGTVADQSTESPTQKEQ